MLGRVKTWVSKGAAWCRPIGRRRRRPARPLKRLLDGCVRPIHVIYWPKFVIRQRGMMMMMMMMIRRRRWREEERS